MSLTLLVFVQKSFLTNNYFHIAEIDSTTRGPLYTLSFCSKIIFDQQLFSYRRDKFDFPGCIVYFSCLESIFSFHTCYLGDKLRNMYLFLLLFNIILYSLVFMKKYIPGSNVYFVCFILGSIQLLFGSIQNLFHLLLVTANSDIG